MSTTILAMLLLNGADLDVLGHALAPQAHGLDSFCYRVPGPPLDTVIEDASGSITIASGAPPSGFSPTWPPASLLDLVEDQRPRFAVGAPVDAPEKQARNEAVIAVLPRVEVPARAPIAIICVARRVAQNEVMRELVVDWAIPVERAAQLARDRLSPCQFEFAEFLAMGHELITDPRGCTTGWGVESRALDEQETAHAAEEEHARFVAQLAAKSFDEVNEKTCDELGVFVITRGAHEPSFHDLDRGPSDYSLFQHPELELFRDVAGTTFAIYDATRLAGLRLGPHPRILEGRSVPPIPVRDFEQKRPVNSFLLPTLHEVRRGSIDDSPVTSFRDARTADGRITGERIIARWKPLADVLCTPSSAVEWAALFVQCWIRSCLPLDGGYAAYAEVVSDAWHRLHRAPANRVLAPAHTVYIDEYGEEWSAFQVERMLGRSLYQENGDFFFQGRPTPLVPKKLPAVMWKAPPLPMSESTYLDLATRAMQGGEHALVGLNELVEEIEPGILETFKARFLPDPWRPVLESFVEGKPHVFASELEEALRAAGEIKEEVFPTKGFGRIGRIMTKLGWEQKQIPLNGRRPKVWIRANDGGAK